MDIPDIISYSERSLGTAPTQVQGDPSYKLTELEEDEEITVDIPTYTQTEKHNSDSLFQPVSYSDRLGEIKNS